MRNYTLIISAALLLVACDSAPPRSELATQAPTEQLERTETERFNNWLDEQYYEFLHQSPMMLTRLGMKERYDELDDMSLQGQQEELSLMRAMVETMRSQFDYGQLDPDAQISWDIMEYALAEQTDAAEFWQYNYTFNQMQGAHTWLVQFMISFHRVDERSDMDAYILRLAELGRALTQLQDIAQASAEKGIRPPRFAFDTVIRESQGVITGQPFDDSEEASPLWQDATTKIDNLLANDVISESEAETLQDGVRDALITHVLPAYSNLVAWLEVDKLHAPENPIGVSRHEGGEAYYAQRLRSNTTTDLSAAEIHEIGLSEVARLRAEMAEVQERMGFEGTFEEYFEFMRTDPQFFYPDTDEGRQAYLDDSKAHLDRIADYLPEFFGILPKAKLEVRRVEPFREQDGAPQHYSRGTPDGSRPGIYYAHLSDMSAMPKTDLEAVAYHEGNPGHHMQISIAQELEDVPRFRTQMGFTVFIEGWALYSELLAKEMGGYQEDYSDFGRLGAEIWRAVRLVVDTGMHAKGWTEEQAFEYFMANVPTSESGARSEIRRYLVIPGQATAYKIGMIRIQELRAHAEQVLGEQFDIRGFHDTVLGGGAVPLPILERRVQQWIDHVKSGR